MPLNRANRTKMRVDRNMSAFPGRHLIADLPTLALQGNHHRSITTGRSPSLRRGPPSLQPPAQDLADLVLHDRPRRLEERRETERRAHHAGRDVGGIEELVVEVAQTADRRRAAL